MSSVRLLVVLATLLLSSPAHAQEVDPAAFARDPFVSSVALSPNGAHIAMISENTDRASACRL
ncbi:MAG: hypothetical protein ACT4OF_03670 [Caulobacteraceae bacterium]